MGFVSIEDPTYDIERREERPLISVKSRLGRDLMYKKKEKNRPSSHLSLTSGVINPRGRGDVRSEIHSSLPQPSHWVLLLSLTSGVGNPRGRGGVGCLNRAVANLRGWEPKRATGCEGVDGGEE